MSKKRIEVKTGDVYGRLTIIKEVEQRIYPNGYKERRVLVQCGCGTSAPFEVTLKSLWNGNTSSCGCLQKQKVSEVNSKTNEYDMSGEYGIGYTSNTNEPFYFDIEDYDLIKDYCWCINNHGYVVTKERTTGKRILLHRLVTQPKNDEVVDHINRNKLDNRKTNLRVCTSMDNAKNRSNKNSVSGVTGVTWNKQASKWQARIMVSGRKKHLGYFTDINEAIRVRIRSELEIFGEYAPTYFCFTEDQRKSILDDTMSSEEIVKILNQKGVDKQHSACYNKDK